VLLAQPDSTRFDLRFRLFGTHVRVHPLFWLLSAVLGWNLTQSPNPVTGNGLGDLALWIGCTFVSILLHEFGHVWAFRAFGNNSHILLHSMGGLAIPDGAPPRRWQRIVVSAAGPGIQLALWGVLVGLIWAGMLPRPWIFIDVSWLPPLKIDDFPRALMGPTPLAFLVGELVLINLIWPLFNLLPIWPLDGGQISREVCESLAPGRGTVTALGISLAVCILLAVNELLGMKGEAPLAHVSRYLRGGSTFNAIFFGLLAFSSFQALQYENSLRRRSSYDDNLPWER
jgi:Zn-dependent protease